MGKKSKNVLKKKLDVTISILTPTTEDRKDVLTLLAKCISTQSFSSKIIQWVIVTAKWSSKSDFENYTKNVLQPILPDHIKIDSYFSDEENALKYGWERVDNYSAIGYLRNISNYVSKGEYLVCCDDDDYYPPTRVEHSVNKLHNSNKLVAGCSPHIMYDVDLNTTFQFKKFNDNHSINSLMAYKRTYLDTGAKYDNTKLFAEEQTFMNGFTTPMIQLDSKHCVVQMVHYNNTFNKRRLIFNSDLVPKEHKNIFKLSSGAKGYVPSDILKEYVNTLTNPSDFAYSEFDIVYYLGSGYPKFKHDQTNLGGSEQAVKHITKEWVIKGYKVCVYGDFDEDTTDSIGVVYKNYLKFKCTQKYKNLIIWRRYGSNPLLRYKLNADTILFDIHDNLPLESQLDYSNINYFMVKSKYHAHMLYNLNKRDHCVNNIESKIRIIPNGVRVDEFTPPDYLKSTNTSITSHLDDHLNAHSSSDELKPSDRDRYKFIYCSCYKRNLENILRYLWPTLKKIEPKVELYVMYGMDSCDEDFKKKMNILLKQPGVTEMGRQPSHVVREYKLKCGFHLYYSATTSETDCITIRESSCAGCIPIISKFGVFANRNGIKLDGDPKNPQQCIIAGQHIASLLKDDKIIELEKIRENIIGKEINWNTIADTWITSCF